MDAAREPFRRYELTFVASGQIEENTIHADYYKIEPGGAITFGMESFAGEFVFLTVAAGYWIKVAYQGHNIP